MSTDIYPQASLPHELVASIQRVLNLEHGPGSDPLDDLSPDFDVVKTLNQLFPDETSLTQIETVQARLEEDKEMLLKEIDALQAQLHRSQDPGRMQLLQDMISELMGQMNRIREKATESEAVVRNITKDIQMLDLAKQNLVTSMTTLKRFQMLANAVIQLDEFVKEKRYADVAQSLAAVKGLSSLFKSSLSIPRISQIWSRIQTIQGDLRTKLDQEFERLFSPDPPNPPKSSTISSACAVVDVIGSDYRAYLIERYCTVKLKEYSRIFRPSDEAGQLDNISRRFAFFRRLLQIHDQEQGRMFPAEWKVDLHLTTKFVDLTRDDLSVLLDKAGAKLTVSVLLETLQHVTEFESSIGRKFAMSMAEILKAATTQTGRVIRPMSLAFDSHMGVFVDAQDKALSDMLASHRGVKSRSSLDSVTQAATSDEGTPMTVVPSSVELFYFYAQSLEQCSKLSTGKPLLDLETVHQKWLKIYAEDVLLPILKRPPGPSRRSLETPDAQELKNACLVINTSDYCQTTALELEQKVQAKIDAQYQSSITFQPERDLFLNIISSGISVLLRELENACEPALATMTKTSWASIETVSGASVYMNEMAKRIEQMVEVVRPMIDQKKYLRNFYDKAASLAITRFTNALVKSRPLKEIGAQQLLIDLQALTTCLLKLPGEESSSNSYGKSILKSTTRLEKLLKVIIIPADPAEAFITNYTLLVGDSSFSNFQKILDLKGTARAEQNNLLDLFVTLTSTKADLESSSFLSYLDMDPPATSQQQPQTGNLISPGSSRVTLPGLLSAGTTAEGILGALASPPPSGPATGSDYSPARTGEAAGGAGGGGEKKREVFSDLRRLVSFGLRRETMPS